MSNVAQLVPREAENAKVLCSILDFGRFLGSIPTFNHFLPKTKTEKREDEEVMSLGFRRLLDVPHFK